MRGQRHLGLAAVWLAAAVPFYGPFPEGGNVTGAKAAVLGIYAEFDARVNATRAALRRASLRHQIVTFPGVEHAFFNPTGSARRPALRRSLGCATATLGLREHAVSRRPDTIGVDGRNAVHVTNHLASSDDRRPAARAHARAAGPNRSVEAQRGGG